MNVKFVVRGLLLALPVAAIATVAWLLLRTPLGQPIPATPPPPTILAAHGEMPSGAVGLQEWARYQGERYTLVGSGFLLSLGNGPIIGVTTAHSLAIGDPQHPLERVALGVADDTGFVAEFDTFWGQPGRPLTVDNLVVDYVLLRAGEPLPSDLALTPDPRGAPQPGERVSLLSGRGGVWEGTVQSVHDRAVWVLMDEWFNPGLMSGSPVVSQHTGQVVGMAVAASPRHNRLLLGLNPIGSLVQIVWSATEFPSIAEFGQQGRQ